METIALRHIGCHTTRALGNKLHDSVTSQIANGNVINGIIGGHIRTITTRNGLYRNLQIATAPACHKVTFVLFNSTHNWSHLIFSGTRPAGMDIIGHFQI